MVVVAFLVQHHGDGAVTVSKTEIGILFQVFR